MNAPEPFVLEMPHGEIHGVLRFPGGAGPHPAVVICHGFKGFMEWGFFPPLDDLLVGRGYATVRFNFTGNGMRPGDELVTAPEAFRHATFSKDLDDLLAVLDAVGGDSGTLGGGRIDRDRLGLLGHSRGGGASILAASQPQWRSRLKALVTWAAVCTFRRFRDWEDDWRKNGELPIQNARTGQELAIGVEVLDDLIAQSDRLDIPKAAGLREMPWLIVHGGADETVYTRDAETLDQHGGDRAELLLVEGAGHTFGAKHPFAGPTPHLTQVLNATQTWFRRHCW